MNCNHRALCPGVSGWVWRIGGASSSLEVGRERWGYVLPCNLSEESRQVGCIPPLKTQLLNGCHSGSGNHTLSFHPHASGVLALHPLSFLVSSPSSCHTFVKSLFIKPSSVNFGYYYIWKMWACLEVVDGASLPGIGPQETFNKCLLNEI